MISPEKWKWYGSAAHLIVGNSCRFHLATKVGKYLISTVGEYYYKDKIEEIGSGRLYETFVFKAGPGCGCGCGLPTLGGSEIDTLPANDAKTANANHLALCKKYAKRVNG